MVTSDKTCRTYNGYDINWHDSWKNALLEVANTGELKHTVLRSPRQKDGRGNISPVTIIMPTLAMEVKQELGQKLSNDVVLNEMINQFKLTESRDPSDEEISEMEDFIKNRESN